MKIGKMKSENNESDRVVLDKELEDWDGESDYILNEPIITRPDRMILEKEQIEKDLREGQEDRVTLDVGGRHFATSRKTLLKDKESLLTFLLQDGKKHYFIDRDGAHFRYILNYLREDCKISLAILPRENRYLLELRNECVYYKLAGLERLVETRIAMYRNLGLAY